MNKIVKRVVVVVAIVLVLFLAAGVVVGNIFYNLALNPASDKSAVTGAEHNQIAYEESEESRLRREKNAAWADEVAPQDTYLQTADGLRLHANVATQEGNLWAILYHGYTGNATQSIGSGRQFYEMGFSVLMPDARGHGESEGSYIGMGWDDRLDLVAWVNQVVEWDPDAQIVLYGVSMGGATVMMTAGEALPPNVKAIVEDCGYSSIWGEFSYQLKAIFGLPSFPVMHFSSLVTRVRAGYWLGEGDAVAQVAKSVTPMMFIHGESDTFVPFSMLQEVYDAANVEKELLAVANAGHGGAASELGEAYWEAVEAFVFRFIER